MSDQPAPLLPVLMGELHAFCKARKGRVNALAAALQTAQPTISAWINGRQEPSGEATLRMQQWLERAKAAEVAELADIEAKKSGALKALSARSKSAPA
jgi:transcriptional regulator with XRE-family HTH domain